MKTAVLLPSFTGIYKDTYELAKLAGKEYNVVFVVDINSVKQLARNKKISSVAIIMGAKEKGKVISAYNAYQKLKNSKLKISIADGAIKREYIDKISVFVPVPDDSVYLSIKRALQLIQ